MQLGFCIIVGYTAYCRIIALEEIFQRRADGCCIWFQWSPLFMCMSFLVYLYFSWIKRVQCLLGMISFMITMQSAMHMEFEITFNDWMLMLPLLIEVSHSYDNVYVPLVKTTSSKILPPLLTNSIFVGWVIPLRYMCSYQLQGL